jgi:WG containing repeat
VDVKGFSDGLALVLIEGKRAYIGKTGKVVIAPEYKSNDAKRFISSASRFSEGLARVDTSGGYSTGYVGFIDKRGKFAIEPRLQGAGDFSEGLAAVLVGKECGYMDRTGRIVIKPQFDETQRFSEGLAAVGIGKRWSYIDKEGKAVIKGPFNDAEAFNGGLARVHEGGKFEITNDGPSYWSGGAWFYINRKGEKVRRCREDDLEFAPQYGKEDR